MKHVLNTSLFLSILVAPQAVAQDSAGVFRPQPLTSPPVANLSAGGPVTLIYTNIPGLPQSLVPGLTSVEFKPGAGTLNFDRVFGSPNGN